MKTNTKEFDALNWKRNFFASMIPILSAMHLKEYYEKTGDFIKINNIIIMKSFMFFPVYSYVYDTYNKEKKAQGLNLFNIYNNLYAYRFGIIDADIYFDLLRNPGLLQGKYYDAYEYCFDDKNSDKKTIDDVYNKFGSAFNADLEYPIKETLKKMSEMGLFQQNERGLVRRAHLSKVWLRAFEKSYGIKYPVKAGDLTKELDGIKSKLEDARPIIEGFWGLKYPYSAD
jgi:hypothetical protein